MACTVQTSAPAPAPVDGTLALDWTLNGVTDPNQCSQAVSVSLVLDVFDGAGAYAH
jgi:hypothetical protein